MVVLAYLDEGERSSVSSRLQRDRRRACSRVACANRCAKSFALAYPAITLLVVSIGAGIIDSLFSPVDHNPL